MRNTGAGRATVRESGLVDDTAAAGKGRRALENQKRLMMPFYDRYCIRAAIQ